MSVSCTVRRSRALIASLLLLLPVARAAAQDRNRACDGAVEYWQAFALLPPLDERQRSIVETWNTAPLNADAQRLIENSSAALKQLHRGSACDKCDWGLHKEDGLGLMMPHLSKGREMSRLAYLRARDRLEHQQFGLAVEDVCDSLVLARRAGQDSFLVALLVEDSMEQMGIDAIGPHLKRLDAAALGALAERLGKLPAGGSLADSVEIERQFGMEWIVSELKSMPVGKDWQEQVAKGLGIPGESVDTGDGSALNQLHAQQSPQKLAEQLQQLRPLFDQFPAALKLPQEQAHARLDAIRNQAANIPLGKVILPDYSRAYDRHMAAEARLTMLRAAVALVQHGQDQLKSFPDPATGQPFEYRSQGNGFELQSKLTLEGKPVTLTVGQ